jgi:hypothetical protein
MRYVAQLLVLSLALGVAGCGAPYRTHHPESRVDRQVSYDNGYHAGLRRGRDAAREGRPFDHARERDYQRGDDGYRREYGDRDRYRDAYREGFERGYREGYNEVRGRR